MTQIWVPKGICLEASWYPCSHTIQVGQIHPMNLATRPTQAHWKPSLAYPVCGYASFMFSNSFRVGNSPNNHPQVRIFLQVLYPKIISHVNQDFTLHGHWDSGHDNWSSKLVCFSGFQLQFSHLSSSGNSSLCWGYGIIIVFSRSAT